MNRKGTREQNDISIIIGNLPKRLQKKFAEDCSAEVENGFCDPRVSRSSILTSSTEDNRGDVAEAECLKRSSKTLTNLSRDVTPDLEASGSTHKNKPINNEVNNMCTLFPGVLRLYTPNDRLPSDRKELDQAARQRSQIQRQEYTIKDMFPLSPVRLPLKLATEPAWFKHLDDIPVAKDLPQLYESLTSLMRRNALLLEWEYFFDIHNASKQIFTYLLLQHLKFVCEQKVDTFFWKLLFYNIREYLKLQISPDATERMLNIIDNGLEYYETLYTALSDKYLFGAIASVGDHARKFEFIAKVAIQKILICLGDLSRYRAKQLQIADYNDATKYYQQAQCLIPTNAIPYNQLAIVALHARKQFDAVYFHMRSLMSSNAIYSAKESLLVLFDEVRKKYEESELKISPVRQQHTQHNRKNSYSRSMRKEIWIYPDGVRRLHRTNLNANDNDCNNEEYSLKQMTTDERMKRFVSLYLYVIGKLYTGIGMETIQTYQQKLFIHFNIVLQSNSLIMKHSRMLKLVALNIFLVEHNNQKETRREIRYHAFNFSNQMFGQIVRKCNKLLSDLDLDSNNLIFEDLNTKNLYTDLSILLQFIRIYTKWLAQNVQIWEPLRSEEHTFTDCWAEVRGLFDNINKFLMRRSNGLRNCDPIIFEEDIFLLGFTPLAIVYNKHEAVNKPSAEVQQFYERLHDILNFEKCLMINEKLLETAVEPRSYTLENLHAEMSSSFENLSDSDDIESNKDGRDTDSSDDNSENIMNGENIEVKLVRSNKTIVDSQLTQLTKLKKELEAKTNVKKMYNAKLQEILNFVDMKLQIEVRPKYLLPDTNCFIDYLEDFERLLQEFKRYTLVIPLTVVKELDGLSKGVKVETYEKFLQKHRIHHYDDVSTRAMRSLDFIKSAKSNVKCATTKGSFINASLFALVEEEHVSNDDKILATAMALFKTMSNETTKDGKCLIRTELVLITTDRNLRVKALSRNLAVSELSEFLQWAKDCNGIS